MLVGAEGERESTYVRPPPQSGQVSHLIPGRQVAAEGAKEGEEMPKTSRPLRSGKLTRLPENQQAGLCTGRRISPAALGIHWSNLSVDISQNTNGGVGEENREEGHCRILWRLVLRERSCALPGGKKAWKEEIKKDRLEPDEMEACRRACRSGLGGDEAL